jgi:ParB family chromosome partitioning protein
MNRSLNIVESAEDDFAVESRLRLELDRRADVPQISSLFELRSLCEAGKRDNEFWRCITIAAARDICLDVSSGPGVDPFDAAVMALAQRRFTESPGGTFDEREAMISGEINLFIQRFLKDEDPMIATTGKLKKPKAAKAETHNAIPETGDTEFEALKATGKSRTVPTEPTPTSEPVRDIDIPLASVVDSPFQTRQEPSTESIEQLAASLKRDGQRDNVVVRHRGGKYELIGGHRRTRAARTLGWKTIRATIMTVDDSQASRLVWDDNRQREDLNAIERAKGLQLIWSEYQKADKSMDQMAIDVGIDQSTISNRIRLLAAPESLQQRLISGEITETRLRGLAKWAAVEGLLERFEKEITLRCESGPISKEHWRSSLKIAIESKSRQTKKHYHYAYQGDPLFPVEKYADELDIREYRLDDDEPLEKRAFNVKRWDQLQKEAKAKLKEKQAKAAAATKSDEIKTRKDPRVLNKRRRDAWLGVLWNKIGETFTQKKTKPEKWMCIRLMHLLESTSDEWVLESLSLTFDEYVEKCIANLVEEWPDSYGWNTNWETLEKIGSHFGVEIRSTWKPTKALLDACMKEELLAFVEECGLQGEETVSIDDLLLNWEPGWVPALFEIEEPKSKAKSKK